MGEEETKQIIIKGEIFSSVIQDVIVNFKRANDLEFDMGAATDSPLKVKILRWLWDLTRYPNEEDVRNAMENDGQYVPIVLNRLLEARILKITNENRFKFPDPVIRILLKYYLDSPK